MSRLRVSNLSFVYPNGVKALDGITFSLDDAGLFLVAGPSGSGKSTLSRLLAGIEPGMGRGNPSGEIEVLGQQVLKHGNLSRPKGVGLVLQNPTSQLLDLTPLECVSDVLLQNGSEDVERKAMNLLEKVGLGELADSYVFSMSDGERQKLALAQVLALNPKLLLLDEPLAHLDPHASEAFSHLLRRLADEGKTILVFEHRLEYLYDLSDRIMILEKGKKVYYGPPKGAFDVMNGELTPMPILLARKLGLKGAFSRREILGLIKKVKLDNFDKEVTSGDEVLKLSRVSFQRKDREILREISLSLRRGEKVALVGENGSGKTTLSLISAGLIKPDDGKVERKGRVMVLFHPPEVHILESSLEKMVGREGLKALGMESRADAHPMTLSKGERLRTVLLSILKQRPDVLILDEPTVGQDQKSLASIMKLVEPMVKRGMALMFATHDLSFVARYADRVIRLRKGKAVFEGPTREYFLFERWFPRPFLVEVSLKKTGHVALRLEEVEHG